MASHPGLIKAFHQGKQLKEPFLLQIRRWRVFGLCSPLHSLRNNTLLSRREEGRRVEGEGRKPR